MLRLFPSLYFMLEWTRIWEISVTFTTHRDITKGHFSAKNSSYFVLFLHIDLSSHAVLMFNGCASRSVSPGSTDISSKSGLCKPLNPLIRNQPVWLTRKPWSNWEVRYRVRQIGFFLRITILSRMCVPQQNNCLSHPISLLRKQKLNRFKTGIPIGTF